MYSISPYMHHYTCSLTCIHWHTCTVVHALHMSSFLCPALTAAHDHYVPPNTSLLVETLAHCIRSHITTAHSVIMLVSSHKHSHHHYSPMLTHMRDSDYHSMHDKLPILSLCWLLLIDTHIITILLGLHTCVTAWQRMVDALTHLCPDSTSDAVRTSCSSAHACTIISANCLQKHTGKNLFKTCHLPLTAWLHDIAGILPLHPWHKLHF